MAGMEWSKASDAQISARQRAENAACAREHRASWRVVQRNCNHSAFNGYHQTWSDYSGLTCLACGRSWRTKADYVAGVPDIKDAEYENIGRPQPTAPHNGMNEDRDIPRFGADETGPF